jgi:hypothetical protein
LLPPPPPADAATGAASSDSSIPRAHCGFSKVLPLPTRCEVFEPQALSAPLLFLPSSALPLAHSGPLRPISATLSHSGPKGTAPHSPATGLDTRSDGPHEGLWAHFVSFPHRSPISGLSVASKVGTQTDLLARVLGNSHF